LIKPRVVEISSQEAMVLSENLSLLKKIGFTIEDFGNNSFLIRSVPMIFGRFEKELITDIIRELSEIDMNVIVEVKEKRIITMACRGSIKAGEELTVPYMTQLINELSITEQPFTCPHGRPTIINVTIAELERKFKRVC
jgi:DNA mismatch repair protein MutL